MNSRWFRIEFAVNGALVSCAKSETGGATTALVVFVRASTVAKAITYARKRRLKLVPLRAAPQMPVQSALSPLAGAIECSPEARRVVLEEAREHFRGMTMGGFGQWLNAEIAAVTPLPAPTLRVVGKR